MLRIVISLGMFLLTSAASLAAAQDSKNESPISISSTETPVASDAVPSWYQRFSGSDNDNNFADWTGLTERDIRLNLTSNPRWNVNLGLTSRDGDTGLPREEMWAGATYNITSRLSIGGAVGLGGEDLGPGAKWGEQKLETGIRLQSAFKF